MQPNSPYVQPPVQPGQQSNYDFIMNSGQQPKKSLLPGGDNMLARVAIVAALLILLLIGFSVLRSVLSGPSNYPYLLSVAQDQTSIAHITDAAQLQTSLSEQNLNFALTAELSTNSDRSDMIGYMQSAGFKVKLKDLNLKISAQADTKLAEAASASTYNETFTEIMKEQLDVYQKDLKTAYEQTKGPKGREMLSKQYDTATLLRKQLESR